MKVRLFENSLRFRLKQPDVNQLEETGKVTQTTEFGPAAADVLSFILEVTEEEELAVNFEGNKVTIGVPESLAKTWISTDMVGFDGKVATGKGKFIDVLVEKDFACLDAPEEENIGAYPNPNAAC